uniref:Uncharacterized protein n=1 Tax=Timema tahoe TaxID=61484 RepID=A0A7R9IH06_9NEOP|nr:unnamed protein product [Timema tahoe]
MFSLAEFIYHWSDLVGDVARGGTPVLIRRGLDHHAISLPPLQHMESLAIQMVTSTGPYQLGTDPYSNLYLPMRNYLDLTAATNCGKVRHIFMKKMQSYFQKPNKR